MKVRHLLVTALSVMVSCLLILSCEDSAAPEPKIESLASFSVNAPDTVTVGQPFTLTVNAVGNQGTKPFKTFNGYVVLSASGGSILPDSLLLGGGTGSGQFVLSGRDDAQTLTAVDGDKKGSVVINAKFMTTLEGNPNDSANEAIPSLEFFADGDDYSDNHPSLSGMYVSHNVIMVAFELGTTVGEANAILGAANPRIVGGVPGEEGVAPGVLFLKLSTSTHADVESILSTLTANDKVNTAVQDVLIGTNAIPQPNDGDPPNWTWELIPGGANWGLERIRVPQMWNFNEAVTKVMTTGGWPRSTALIIDEGFLWVHEDIHSLFANPLAAHPHGAHVAGIIGATYDNGKGIDGICPNVFMLGKDVPLDPGGGTYQDLTSAGQAIISALYFGMRAYVDVVNMSLGYNWADAGIDSDNDLTAQNIVMKQAQVLVNTLNLGTLSYRSPLIVVSAGNDSGRGFGDQDARYNSPMCYAAIGLGIENIIVVEAIQDSPGVGAGNATRYPRSSIGGHISAPGYDVWGTTNEASSYRSGNGTSYAAAVVTGIVAYLNVLEPYLDFRDIRDVITSNALSVGGGAQPRVDAWASVVDLDRVRSGENFLQMMCDIDDGTADGNLRVTYDGGVYLEEDADQDGGIGDGNVDMSDFRRWRDWFILTDLFAAPDLDGGPNHPKKDVNKNGTVEDAAGENVYPRGDLNGNGSIDNSTAAYVPGAIAGEVTDLEVFQNVFNDPDYSSTDLPNLLYSSDYHVDATVLLQSATNVYAQILRMPSQDLAAEHTFKAGEPVYVFTMPPHSGGYKVEVTADGEEYEIGDRTFTQYLGDDAIFKPLVYIPLNPKGTYLHMCGELADPAVPIALASYGIKPGDVICIDNEGLFAYGSDPNNTSYDQIAVFSSNSTLLPMSSSHRVPGAIDAGNDFTTWVTNGCGGETTDITEDFSVVGNGTILTVPAGAAYLFVCGHDSGYEDNWAPSGRFGVQLSIVKVPDEHIDE